MASNIERMTENDTNNGKKKKKILFTNLFLKLILSFTVASNMNAKSLVEDVAEKKKIALDDIKNKIDPNSNQNQNKNEKNNGKIENLIGQTCKYQNILCFFIIF